LLEDPLNCDDDDPEIAEDPIYNMDLQVRISEWMHEMSE